VKSKRGSFYCRPAALFMLDGNPSPARHSVGE